MKKFIKPFIVVILFYLIQFLSFANSELTQVEKADTLKTLGLLTGDGKSYHLDRIPTRAETAVMLIRLIGKEEAAKALSAPHPFTDVPDWADPYVGYMYQNKLTAGVGNNLFGAALNASSQQYITFLLRALGHDDTQGDFKYNEATNYAVSAGLLTESQKEALNSKTFLRGDMVEMSYQSLSTKLKSGTETLLESLIEKGAVSNEAASKTELMPKQEADGSKELTYEELGSSFPTSFLFPVTSDRAIEYCKATITLNSKTVKIIMQPGDEPKEGISVEASIVGGELSGAKNVVLTGLNSTLKISIQRVYNANKPYMRKPSTESELGCSQQPAYILYIYGDNDRLLGIAFMKDQMGTFNDVIVLTNPDSL